jgi:hypothetical protein
MKASLPGSVLSAAIAAAVGVGYAASSSSSTIHGCYKSNGQLRISDSEARTCGPSRPCGPSRDAGRARVLHEDGQRLGQRHAVRGLR